MYRVYHYRRIICKGQLVFDGTLDDAIRVSNALEIEPGSKCHIVYMGYGSFPSIDESK